MIKVYKVKWCIIDGGQYVPPDPVSGGDYYRDAYGMDIIPALTVKMAKEIVEKARPLAKIRAIKVLTNLEV